MICMDINLKFYFNDGTCDGNGRRCEKAIEELFNDIFCERKEYVKTEARVQDIKEVIEE